MPFELIRPGTEIDFIGKWRICAAVSLALILIGLASIPVRGFRLGIDFAGGTEVQVRFPETPSVDEGEIRDVVQQLGIQGASVIRYGADGSNEFLLKFAEQLSPPGADVAAGSETPASAEAAPAEIAAAESDAPSEIGAAEGDAGSETATPGDAAEAVAAELAPAAGGGAAVTPLGERRRVDALAAALEQRIGPLVVERVEFVGPKVGAELRRAGILALTVACLLILIYIALRFSTRYAPGAVVALVHDVLITSGLWVLLGLEFDLRVLAALLAIVGYSLNDTIIVYDRIRENMELRTRRDLAAVLNESVNQTLARTLLTSGTTLVAVLSLLLLGGEVIRPFAMAMTIGILVGTYSSIYVAAPTLLFLESRFGSTAQPARARA